MDVKRCIVMIVAACALGLHAEFFNSFDVTNSHWQAAFKRTACIMAQDARSVVIDPGGLDSDELALAKSLVFLSLRKRSVRTEVSLDIDEPVRLRVTPFEGWTDYDLSFSYFGARIDAYDVQCVPFVVTNRRNNHRMKVALFKFMKDGRFVFAEYANLNNLQVSPIFARNYTMRTYLAYQSEFPWLSDDEVRTQRLYVEWLGNEEQEKPSHVRNIVGYVF